MRLGGHTAEAGPYDLEITLLHRGLATIPIGQVGELDSAAVDELLGYLEASAEQERR